MVPGGIVESIVKVNRISRYVTPYNIVGSMHSPGYTRDKPYEPVCM